MRTQSGFLAIVIAGTTLAITCAPGTFYWVSEGIERCATCQPGCACAGNFTICAGCSGGFFSQATGASACSACAPGTTTELIENAGCNPQNFLTPCANQYGPLGFTACHPVPPAQRLAFAMPSGALFAPPQYLTNSPPYVPNKVPPYYDINGLPMVQQSY